MSRIYGPYRPRGKPIKVCDCVNPRGYPLVVRQLSGDVVPSGMKGANLRNDTLTGRCRQCNREHRFTMAEIRAAVEGVR